MKRKNYQKDITHPHFFAVRLSDMELEFLNQKSEKLGISKAEVIRKLLSENQLYKNLRLSLTFHKCKNLSLHIGKSQQI